MSPHPFRDWNPSSWAGLAPNGLGQVKPNHFADMAKTVWQNRDRLPYAWRVLTRGVCDGCALGTTGLRDFTIPGLHLCTVRLHLLRLNTMPAMAPDALEDAGALRALSGRELRALGRLAFPMVRRRGVAGFRRVSWDEALDLVAARLRGSDPERFACYVTSRGITNEVYYAVQKAVRFLGTNNVDNSARLCHAPSTVALKEQLGVGASTCSYTDWIGSDLVVFLGSDAANNQPVAMKYLYYAKRAGTRVVLVNPLREPGLERYWVPSVLESALFGTKLVDEHFALQSGGDAAFLNGVLKAVIAAGGVDRAFLAAHTTGFGPLETALAGESWEALERASGASRADMERFAALYVRARHAVFVWSMGVTQDVTGTDNVRAIVNLALARGMVGRDHTGLMPIRGHSGVQGGSEVGCVPNFYPGGVPVGEAGAGALCRLWGFTPPISPGLAARAMIEAAHDGKLEVFYAIGGNFLETLPDPAYVAEALGRVPLRVHQDLVVTRQMLLDPAETVVLLPARTRYEQEGGGTETTTERQVVFSPYIPGHDVGEARAEWKPLVEIAARVRPGEAARIAFADTAAIRADIARAVPFYAGIERLAKQGDHVQYGGRHLCAGGHFATADGRARFAVVVARGEATPPGRFRLTTRRGQQFNSMVHGERDPLTGATREDILIAREDAAGLGLGDGARIVMRSAVGVFRGRVRLAPIRPGEVQGFWPEVNVLLPRDRFDAPSGVPDYGTIVSLEPDTAARRSVASGALEERGKP